MKQEEPILVAIQCFVYNHEPYLRECLDGFVMQKTNFRFVAIVHDDASTDNSAAIIREYAERYPDIFRPIYETENRYSKHDGSIESVLKEAIEATGAKYIAMCEGDDYWTEPLKLQKQVDFLEGHPDYSICSHGYSILNQYDGTIRVGNTIQREEAKCGITFTNNGNMLQWYTKTLTNLIRKDAYQSLPDISEFRYWCDTYMCYYLLKHSKGFYLPFNGGIYREHGGGVYSSLSLVHKGMMNIRQYDEMYAHNPEDEDLYNMLLYVLKEEEDELIWLIRDKKWCREYFNAIREISGVLLRYKQYSHLLKWRWQLVVAGLKRIKRNALYKSFREVYRKSCSKK